MSYLGVGFSLIYHDLHRELGRHLCANNSVQEKKKSQAGFHKNLLKITVNMSLSDYCLQVLALLFILFFSVLPFLCLNFYCVLLLLLL